MSNKVYQILIPIETENLCPWVERPQIAELLVMPIYNSSHSVACYNFDIYSLQVAI